MHWQMFQLCLDPGECFAAVVAMKQVSNYDRLPVKMKNNCCCQALLYNLCQIHSTTVVHSVHTTFLLATLLWDCKHPVHLKPRTEKTEKCNYFNCISKCNITSDLSEDKQWKKCIYKLDLSICMFPLYIMPKQLSLNKTWALKSIVTVKKGQLFQIHTP